MLNTAEPVCGPALSKTISLLPLLLPVNDTLPPIFHVQLAVVAALLLTAEILAAVPGPTITSPAIVCVTVPDVVAIPLNVPAVIERFPFIVKFAGAVVETPPFDAVAYVKFPYTGADWTVVVPL
jgi:hypothetical protein